MPRQICCHKTDTRPLYKCQHIEQLSVPPTRWPKFNPKTIIVYCSPPTKECGNLMHADCIERFGKCHTKSGVKKWQSNVR